MFRYDRQLQGIIQNICYQYNIVSGFVFILMNQKTNLELCSTNKPGK